MIPSVSRLVLTVNGAKRGVDAPPEESLLSVLRNRLQLTGSDAWGLVNLQAYSMAGRVREILL